ncbi:HEAT repeat domain-containing protein [Fontivita pretiosa]|uniref:HEAT repeat domain-containing protein n=1 Tax=Fontivita pretiosa TaxID=2989684 RepID=UPI003D177584
MSMMQSRVGVAAIALIVCMLSIWAGCGPKQPRVKKVTDLPKRPPAPPPVANVPIDPALRSSAKEAVLAAFRSNDPRLRTNAVEAIEQTFARAEARTLIIEALRDSNLNVRWAAALAAGRLRLTDLHDELWTMAQQDPSPRPRIGARFALHKLGDVRLSHDLEKTAVDPDRRVREDTAFVLGLLGEKSALKILPRMLNDSDAGVRIAAAEAMWKLGDERGLEALVAGIVSKFADDQMIALQGIVGPRDQRVRDYVYGKLTDEYDEVALVAARAMGELGFDDGYAVAMKYLNSRDPRQRELAAVALGRIGRSDAQPLLSPLLQDEQPRVRLAAATALLQLKESSATASSGGR